MKDESIRRWVLPNTSIVKNGEKEEKRRRGEELKKEVGV